MNAVSKSCLCFFWNSLHKIEAPFQSGRWPATSTCCTKYKCIRQSMMPKIALVLFCPRIFASKCFTYVTFIACTTRNFVNHTALVLGGFRLSWLNEVLDCQTDCRWNIEWSFHKSSYNFSFLWRQYQEVVIFVVSFSCPSSNFDRLLF